MKRNPLIHTLLNLRGNSRAAIYTEPLWGLSMALALPYLSVFMLALGLHDGQVGLLTTVGMVSQVGFGIVAGVVTDKLGRRRATALFDAIAHVIPAIIWAASQNFWYFLGAAIIAGAGQVPAVAWDCLLIEDAPREQTPTIYSLARISADLSALFAPVAAVLVAQFSLVPAVRILFINGAVLMLLKIGLLYRNSTETGTGRARLAAVRGVPTTRLLAQYRGVICLVLNSAGSRLSLAVMATAAAVTAVNLAFWPVLVTTKLGVADWALPFFPMARSLLTMVLFFTVIQRLSRTYLLRQATAISLGVYLTGQLLLANIPASEYPGMLQFGLIGVSLLLDAFGAGALFMVSESLFSLHANRAERSRVMAIQRTAVLLVASPAGLIAGWLSGIGRTYPFWLTSALLAVALLLATTRWVAPPDAPARRSGRPATGGFTSRKVPR